MEIDKLLDELIILLDNDSDIKRLKEINKNINPTTLELFHKYQTNKTVDSKKELYQNKEFKEYITSYNNVHYLIMNINSKFKRGKCENNKW